MKSSFHPFRLGLLFVLALGCVAPAMAQTRRVDPQDLYRYWILLNTSIKLDAPNSGFNLDKPGCAAVTYTVGSDGVPMNVALVKLVPKSDLGPMAVSAVSHFRYGPSLTNRVGEPVATYYVVPFNAPTDKAQRQHLLDACKLPGYGP
ncbi:MAG: energy transducer TonB [Rhodanobacter sp.]|nr:MAG: energy transducer TonB [Rhodanobacter sp.]